MCATCGCSNPRKAIIGVKSASAVSNRRTHPPAFSEAGVRYRHYEAADAKPARVDLDERILAKNDLHAQRNRTWLAKRNILALNLLSSPGSGKTTLLERTLHDLRSERSFCVIEGDQESTLDADRIRATGAPALQINTGAGCHLEAQMVARALGTLMPPPGSIVMIENVGNLVCPALFDLGENAKVLLISVTEGDDKPLKYPHMFRAANLVLINKIDLLPYVPFDAGRCVEHARRMNRAIETLEVSATTGAGMSRWYDWLRKRMPALRAAGQPDAAALRAL